MSYYLWVVFLALHFTGAAAYAGPDLEAAALLQEIEHYELLLQKEGRQAKTLNGIGFSYYRLNRIPEALDAYQNAIVVDPGYALAYNNLGAAYLSIKKYAQGEAAFRQALQIDPARGKAAYNLAVALFRQNRYLDAYHAYCKAKEIDAAYVKQRLDKSRAREELQGKLKNDPYNQFLLLALKKLDAE